MTRTPRRAAAAVLLALPLTLLGASAQGHDRPAGDGPADPRVLPASARVVPGDGRAVEGTYGFRVDAPAVPVGPARAGAPAHAAASPVAAPAWPWVVGASALATVVTAAVALWRRRR
ncbi:hypothetical protein [Cellulomonas telluris]|uniref:hypothetical protein n=1 Tax=Cellulomonas telluris TaxID=2306636 RepID=UPI0010A8E616|nr:hypothetical protein [Cellulomonas telluris]